MESQSDTIQSTPDPAFEPTPITAKHAPSLMAMTADIPDRFFDDMREGCDRMGCDPIDLMSVMFSESGLYASAQNPNGKATGILQFMPAILHGLGWSRGEDAFKHLDAAQQLSFAFAYFTPWEKYGAPWSSAGRIYQATFLPATLAQGSGDDFVLCGRSGKLGWAYAANAAFDANGDGTITIGELTQAITRNCRGSRWDDCNRRLTGSTESTSLPPELVTTAGIQAALKALGFDPGPIDGANGPKTRAAVIAFQTSRGLTPDGIVGPATLSALKAVA